MEKKVVVLSRQYLEYLPQSFKAIAYLKREQGSAQQLPVLQNLSAFRDFLASHEVNAVVVASDTLDLFEAYERELRATGLPIVIANQGEGDLYVFANMPKSFPYLFIKRLIDILMAVVGLLLMAFVAIVIFPIVKQQSPGPILFKQKRVGKNGKPFYMYKFRSMYLDAEQKKADLLGQNELNSDLMFKIENDPRIFPFGQKLRQWSIDELPQFINVLKGDMSVIGTRPPTLDEYQKYDFHHFKRLAMKPGITGLWQVSGRSNIQDFEDVVALDVTYIENWSLWYDLKILIKTIKVVLLKEGSR